MVLTIAALAICVSGLAAAAHRGAPKPDRRDATAMSCEELAASSTDPDRATAGVPFSRIDVETALPVCKEAAEKLPARARYQHLYARVLDAAKRYEEAAALYDADRFSCGSIPL